MKILLPSDGSKNATRALKFAISLVKGLDVDSSITLLSVHDDAGLRHAQSFVGKEAIHDYLHDLSEKELKSAVKTVDQADIKHEVVIKTGHVATEIVELATKGKFDLIVLGSKGRSALADMLIGSVAQRVLATAKQPVVVVK